MTKRHHLLFLCSGNFFTAIGAGALFADGLHLVAELKYLKFDSILAYLLATVLQLFIVVRARRNELSRFWSYSLLTVVFACVLKFAWSNVGKGIFEEAFLFLSLTGFFALSFVPRFLRGDCGSKLIDGFNVLELAYWGGYMLMLSAWSVIARSWGLEAPAVGVAALSMATAIDFAYARRAGIMGAGLARREATRSVLKEPEFLLGTTVFLLLTICVQVVVKRVTSVSQDTSLLTAFYGGILIASIYCAFKRFPLEISRVGDLLGARSEWARGFSASLALVFILCAALSGLSVILVLANEHGLALAFFALTAFTYEVLAMAILSEIGRRWAAVSLSFSFCGVGVALSYALLLFADIGLQGCLAVVLLTAFIALLIDRSWIVLFLGRLRAGKSTN